MGDEKILTPIKAIRAKCLDCCNGSIQRVKFCEDQNCTLYPYREGKNPNRQGIGGGTDNFKNKPF